MKFQTRRDFFKSLAALGIMGFVAPAAYAKVPKKQVAYQETPKNGETCDKCIHFLPETNGCKVVEGSIEPKGWCSLYVQKR